MTTRERAFLEQLDQFLASMQEELTEARNSTYRGRLNSQITAALHCRQLAVNVFGIPDPPAAPIVAATSNDDDGLTPSMWWGC